MYIGPEEFERRWNNLMEEFGLVDHKWLSKMYSIRSSWIPAFFIDSPLCGLMRTTSRSESENSFFSHFTSRGATLVKFMICYDSAMEQQRYKQERLDHQSIDSFPTLLTPLAIEVHAARVYTRSLFVRVQKEIIAGSWLCSIKAKSSDELCDICIIKEEIVIPVSMPDPDKINKAEDSDDDVEEINLYEKSSREYKVHDCYNIFHFSEHFSNISHVLTFCYLFCLMKVVHNTSDDSVVCCCQLFVRCGILCRHVFCVFKNCNVQKIPNQYLLRRWTRDLIPPDIRRKKNRYGEKNENVSNLVVQATSLVDDCCQILRNDESRLSGFVDKLKALKSEFEADVPSLPRTKVSDVVQEFMGIQKPDQLSVKNPSVTKKKGDKNKVNKDRIKGGREQSFKENKKRKPAGCGICGLSDHNRRTCPNKEKVAALYGGAAGGSSSSGGCGDAA